MRIIIVLFFTFFQIINAQQKDELKLITSGKWYIDYFEVSGQKMESSADEKDFNWVIYHDKGEYEGMEEGDEYFGTWEFNNEKKIIKIDDMNGETEQKLISITEKTLVISVDDDGMEMIIGMKKD